MLIWVNPEMLEYIPHGYFRVERPVTTFDYIYADWYAWPYFKGKYLAVRWFWSSIHWGFRHGIIRPTNPRNEVIRIRGIRFGRHPDA